MVRVERIQRDWVLGGDPKKNIFKAGPDVGLFLLCQASTLTAASAPSCQANAQERVVSLTF